MTSKNCRNESILFSVVDAVSIGASIFGGMFITDFGKAIPSWRNGHLSAAVGLAAGIGVASWTAKKIIAAALKSGSNQNMGR